MRRSKSSDPSFRYTNNMSRIPVSTIHGACHWCGSRNHYLGAWAQVHQTSGKGRCDCPYIVVGMSYEESREHVRKSALAGGDGELGMGQCRLITPQTNALILPKNFITDGCLAKLAGWKCPTEADPNYAVPAKPQQPANTYAAAAAAASPNNASPRGSAGPNLSQGSGGNNNPPQNGTQIANNLFDARPNQPQNSASAAVLRNELNSMYGRFVVESANKIHEIIQAETELLSQQRLQNVMPMMQQSFANLLSGTGFSLVQNNGNQQARQNEAHQQQRRTNVVEVEDGNNEDGNANLMMMMMSEEDPTQMMPQPSRRQRAALTNQALLRVQEPQAPHNSARAGSTASAVARNNAEANILAALGPEFFENDTTMAQHGSNSGLAKEG